MTKALLIAAALLATPATAQVAPLPAPAGDATAIAASAIRAAEHPCGKVASASRLRDGTIRALCSNGEAYRVMRMKGIAETVALKCSAAAKLGVSGC